jgi:hypothetical protein
MSHSIFNPLTNRGATNTTRVNTVVSGLKPRFHTCNKLLFFSTETIRCIAQWPGHNLVQLFFEHFLVKLSWFVLALDRQLWLKWVQLSQQKSHVGGKHWCVWRLAAHLCGGALQLDRLFPQLIQCYHCAVLFKRPFFGLFNLMLHHGRRRAVLRNNLFKCHPFGFLIFKSQRLCWFLSFFFVFQHLRRFNFPQAKLWVYRFVILVVPGNNLFAIRRKFEHKQNTLGDSLLCVFHQITYVVKDLYFCQISSIQTRRVFIWRRDIFKGCWLNVKERLSRRPIYWWIHKHLPSSSGCDESSWTCL